MLLLRSISRKPGKTTIKSRRLGSAAGNNRAGRPLHDVRRHTPVGAKGVMFVVTSLNERCTRFCNTAWLDRQATSTGKAVECNPGTRITKKTQNHAPALREHLNGIGDQRGGGRAGPDALERKGLHVLGSLGGQEEEADGQEEEERGGESVRMSREGAAACAPKGVGPAQQAQLMISGIHICCRCRQTVQ